MSGLIINQDSVSRSCVPSKPYYLLPANPEFSCYRRTAAAPFLLTSLKKKHIPGTVCFFPPASCCTDVSAILFTLQIHRWGITWQLWGASCQEVHQQTGRAEKRQGESLIGHWELRQLGDSHLCLVRWRARHRGERAPSVANLVSQHCWLKLNKLLRFNLHVNDQNASRRHRIKPILLPPVSF